MFGCVSSPFDNSAVGGIYRNTGNVEDYTNCKEAHNLVTIEIRKSKRTVEQKLAGNINKLQQEFKKV